MTPLVAADSQQLDNVNELPVLRKATTLTDRLAAPTPINPLQAAAAAAQADALPQGIIAPPSLSTPGVPQPPAQPAAQPVPQNAVQPAAEPSRFENRLNSIYGQAKTAEQRAAEAELRLAQLLQNLNNPQPVSAPAPAQYVPSPIGTPAPATTQDPYSFHPQQPAPLAAPPSDFISRQELGRILQERDAQLANEAQLRQSHTISRLEAERQFPDVFENPATRAALDRVWSQDRFLQSDPRGPEKAAALVRGMFFDPRAAVAAGPAASGVQKVAAGGFGVSAPGDTGAATTSPQLTAALARARATGRREDWDAAYRLFGPTGP